MNKWNQNYVSIINQIVQNYKTSTTLQHPSPLRQCMERKQIHKKRIVQFKSQVNECKSLATDIK